eukprot:777153-Prorocentrum_minimum.AAC.1
MSKYSSARRAAAPPPERSEERTPRGRHAGCNNKVTKQSDAPVRCNASRSTNKTVSPTGCTSIWRTPRGPAGSRTASRPANTGAVTLKDPTADPGYQKVTAADAPLCWARGLAPSKPG